MECSINDIPKSVISRSPKELVWRNSEQILIQDSNSFVQEIQALKNKSASISVESGLKTWQLFIEHELFDELWVFVHPVIVSQGNRLFEPSDKQHNLLLTSSKTYSNGVLGLYYQKKV